MATKKVKLKAIKAVAPERVPSAEAVNKYPAVYVMRHSTKGQRASDAEHAADMKRINDYIAKHGGKCTLYGSDDDHEFVTIIRDLSPQLRAGLVKVIEAGGNVTAGQMHILKNGGGG